MTEVLSIEYTEILNVTMTAHCRDCASRSDQHESQVNARSLHVRCEPCANSEGGGGGGGGNTKITLTQLWRANEPTATDSLQYKEYPETLHNNGTQLFTIGYLSVFYFTVLLTL